MIAAYYGLRDIVDLLVAAKANISQEDASGKTAIHWARQKGFWGIAADLSVAQVINQK